MKIVKSRIFKGHIKIIYTENEIQDLLSKYSTFPGFDKYLNAINNFLSEEWEKENGGK